MNKICINNDWSFYKNISDFTSNTGKVEKVNLPHTYNNFDGQDGGADYFRGKVVYVKTINVFKKDNKDYYFEFEGANSICEVYVNGKFLVRHEGGYSLFRAKATDLLIDGTNQIKVYVDNSPNDYVYPQMADFTFFGGLYRDVFLLEVSRTRFDIDYFGGTGVTVTPTVEGNKGHINIKNYITNNLLTASVVAEIFFEGEEVCEAYKKAGEDINLTIEHPILWDGVKDNNLYNMTITLYDNETVLDRRDINFGFRYFSCDKNGFTLNGRSYPLRGVSRHQDRLDLGYAITTKQHEEDMALIKEIGANSIRLAHYQHDSYFYDLCDKNGMVVWAEIPYISSHLEKGNDNAINQLTELIVQNYNHPSIVFWGISNEITITGETDEVVKLNERLNSLAKQLDKTRLTTIANFTMLNTSSKLLDITDVIAYNHYYGWYMGEVSDNASWLDDFRKEHPDKTIGLSEYGAEGILSWHTSEPKCGDYTEEYQAYYHEKMLEIIEERPYLWGTYVWNMFDFAVDSRNEGGVKGRNNKGLVTYDRQTKKDSFYVYKAHWSNEPFIHIMSKRYVYRNEKTTKVLICTNQTKVSLYVNDKLLQEKNGKYIFEFDVPLNKITKTEVTALSGNLKDTASFKYVSKPKEEYILKQEKSTVINWFDKNGNEVILDYPKDRLSIKDKLSTIMSYKEGEQLILILMDNIAESFSKEGKQMPMGVSKTTLKMFGSFSIERLITMVGDKISTEQIKFINDKLNEIEK